MGYGRGFGFRGAAPAWPYIGRGRGGLPRCWYPGLAAGVAPYATPWMAPGWSVPPGEEELDILKQQADDMKAQLEDIEQRIRELENTN